MAKDVYILDMSVSVSLDGNGICANRNLKRLATFLSHTSFSMAPKALQKMHDPLEGLARWSLRK